MKSFLNENPDELKILLEIGARCLVRCPKRGCDAGARAETRSASVSLLLQEPKLQSRDHDCFNHLMALVSSMMRVLRLGARKRQTHEPKEPNMNKRASCRGCGWLLLPPYQGGTCARDFYCETCDPAARREGNARRSEA